MSAATVGTRGRLVLLLGGGLGLLVGTATGLARAGVPPHGGPVAAHGVIIVLGFLGTLIALERAVAFGARWTFAAPALSTGGVVHLTIGGPTSAAAVAFAAAGAVVTGVYVLTLRRHWDAALAIMGLGALAWTTAAVLWLVGTSPVRLAPMLGAFLVLTIIGERLELSRLGAPTRRARSRLLVAVAVFSTGVVLSVPLRDVGVAVAGIGMIALAAWFIRHDIARVTVRRSGLPRFAAVCMLVGYLWLVVSGASWVALGTGIGGPLVYDAALHSLFLGFVTSMVFGHAPIILPAVLHISLPYRRIAWLPLVVLHVSVLVRVGVDLAGSTWGRGLSAYGNAGALLLFVATSAATAIRATRRSSTSADASTRERVTSPERPTPIPDPDHSTVPHPRPHDHAGANAR